MNKSINKIKDWVNSKGSWLYSAAITPRSSNEDIARREFIFNVLLLGMTSLSFITFFSSLGRFLADGHSEQNIKPVLLAVPLIILSVMYLLSRRSFNNRIVYVFIGIIAFLGTYGLYLYSYVLPQGLLIYSLVIVISGILISARTALVMTVLIIVSLCILSYFQINQILHPYTAELNDPLRMNLAIYIFIFITIYLVSWLYSRDVNRSLQRARESEAMLAKERDTLEVKVKQRAKELERIQMEKARELYRFAEFGRISSSLLHDLASPLTAVSLNMENLEGKRKPRAIRQIQKGVNYMEEYVASARRQLNNQTENKWFDCAEVVSQVITFISPKAKSSRVKIRRHLNSGLNLYGNSTKFSQIVSNLIGNAIDAYEADNSSSQKTIMISLGRSGNELHLTVSDKGEGIAPSELNKLFDPFFSTKTAGRGTGLGLTITKRIVEEDFKGRIEVSSKKLSGTIFKVVIPYGDVKYDK